MARTNIEIDDETLDVVMRRYAIHTKTEAVDLALRRLAGEPMTIAQALEMRGARAISDVPADTAP
jgi:Arc/MetJ family transcription regulator